MKKILFFLLLTFVGFNATAQEEQIPWKSIYPQDIEKKYELKLNAFNLIAFASVDISYERLINANSSFGVAVFYNFANYAESDVVFPKKSSVTPYYRWFFSDYDYARGFFVEGFGMLNTFQEDFINLGGSSYSSENETAFALGISIGGKFVTKRGFTAEVLFGVGRNLIKGEENDNYISPSVVGRFGISLGYRF